MSGGSLARRGSIFHLVDTFGHFIHDGIDIVRMVTRTVDQLVLEVGDDEGLALPALVGSAPPILGLCIGLVKGVLIPL